MQAKMSTIFKIMLTFHIALFSLSTLGCFVLQILQHCPPLMPNCNSDICQKHTFPSHLPSVLLSVDILSRNKSEAMDSIKHTASNPCPIAWILVPNLIPGIHEGNQVMNDLIDESSLGYYHTALFLISLNFSVLDSMEGWFLANLYANNYYDIIDGLPMYTANIILLNITEGDNKPGRKWGIVCYFCNMESNIVWEENVSFGLRLAFDTTTRINSIGSGDPAQLDIRGMT